MHAQVLKRSCTIQTCFFHPQLYSATGDVVKNLFGDEAKNIILPGILNIHISFSTFDEFAQGSSSESVSRSRSRLPRQAKMYNVKGRGLKSCC